jgi:hypothetical protein
MFSKTTIVPMPVLPFDLSTLMCCHRCRHRSPGRTGRPGAAQFAGRPVSILRKGRHGEGM